MNNNNALANSGLAVVGGAILRDGLVLCAKRPPGGQIGGMWEFPGGKVEPGETLLETLVRECQEELSVIVQPKLKLAETTMQYPRGPITLTTFLCELADAAAVPQCVEHEALRWLPIPELPQLNWAPLDREAVQALSQLDLIPHLAVRLLAPQGFGGQ
jgi:8-oxo-dGTP diphosphatase